LVELWVLVATLGVLLGGVDKVVDESGFGGGASDDGVGIAALVVWSLLGQARRFVVSWMHSCLEMMSGELVSTRSCFDVVYLEVYFLLSHAFISGVGLRAHDMLAYSRCCSQPTCQGGRSRSTTCASRSRCVPMGIQRVLLLSVVQLSTPLYQASLLVFRCYRHISRQLTLRSNVLTRPKLRIPVRTSSQSS